MAHLTPENSSERFLVNKIAGEGRGLGNSCRLHRVLNDLSRAGPALLWVEPGEAGSLDAGRLDRRLCYEAGVL